MTNQPPSVSPRSDRLRDIRVLSERHSPAARLLTEALLHASANELAEARRTRDEAVAAAPEHPLVQLTAGILSLLVREYDRALLHFATAGRLDTRRAGEGFGLAFQGAEQVCWNRDLHELAVAGLRIPECAPRARSELIALYSRFHVSDRALELMSSTPEASRSATDWLDLGQVALRTGDHGAARAAAVAVLRSGAEHPRLFAAIEMLVRAGAIDQASERLREHLEKEPGRREALGWLGRLALCGAHWSEARRWADHLLSVAPEDALGHRILGVVAYQEKQYRVAIEALSRAVALEPRDHEAHAWRALARAAAEPKTPVLDDIEQSQRLYPAQTFARTIVSTKCDLLFNPRFYLDPAMIDALPVLENIRPGGAAIVERGDAAEVEAVVDEVLAAMAGNLSDIHTIQRNGQVAPAQLGLPREECAEVAGAMQILSLEDVSGRLRRVADRYPASSLPLAYLGEIRLWLGQVDEARRFLTAAIEHTPKTRWAYIGLAGCALLDDEPGKALEWLELGFRRMENTSGPAAPVYRGEALRRLGRFEEARTELQNAVELCPARVSAWLNLGLVHGARGETADAARAFVECRSRAPGLVSDAADELKQPAWVDADGLPDPAAQQALLGESLRMLRGNRSSGLITYFRSDGRLRTAVSHPSTPGGTDASHERCMDLIRQIMSESRP